MRTPVGVAVAVLMGLGALQAFSHRETPPLAATQLAVDRMQLNTLNQSKAAMVAGGELGTMLYSNDQGKHWLPAKVSNNRQALINQISFAPDGMEGMAVGHEGWILHTTDGGLTWQEVAFDEKNGEPLMGIARLPSGAWIAVGAFGRALRSDAQGKNWAPLVLPAAVEDKHMNRIVGSADGQRWLIVGERGLVLRSTDSGDTWTVVEPFYNGSLYNALALPNGGWLAYGMRGNVFHTAGGDAPWTASEMPVQASFYSHSLRPDGTIVLVGQGSLVATSKDGGAHFTISRVQGRASLTDVLLAPDGTGWLASDAGLQPYSVVAAGAVAPAPAAQPAPSTKPASVAEPAPAASSTPSSNGAAQ